MIDLGVQPQEFKGEAKAPRNEMMLTYEFLDEFLPDDDGEPNEEKPRWLSETLPLHSLESDRAKSTQRYLALDPNVEEDGDFTALIERPCMVTVVQNKSKDKIYNNIASVSSMRPKEAAKAPELVNPPKVFLMDEPDVEIFLSLPQWIQDKIKDSLEYAGSPLEKALDAHTGEGSSKKEKAASGSRKASKEEPEAEADGIPFDEDEDQGEW